jgi:Na+/melibiose symporter-like transporter
MRSLIFRILILAAGTISVFAGVVGVLLHVIPGPHKQLDYLVIGSAATLAALVALFLVLIGTWARTSGTLRKRNEREPGETG